MHLDFFQRKKWLTTDQSPMIWRWLIFWSPVLETRRWHPCGKSWLLARRCNTHHKSYHKKKKKTTTMPLFFLHFLCLFVVWFVFLFVCFFCGMICVCFWCYLLWYDLCFFGAFFVIWFVFFCCLFFVRWFVCFFVTETIPPEWLWFLGIWWKRWGHFYDCYRAGARPKRNPCWTTFPRKRHQEKKNGRIWSWRNLNLGESIHGPQWDEPPSMGWSSKCAAKFFTPWAIHGGLKSLSAKCSTHRFQKVMFVAAHFAMRKHRETPLKK